MPNKSVKLVDSLKHQRVLVRLDLDVPLKQENKKTRKQKNKIIITDDSRLKDMLSTIKYLLKKQAKIILIGHLGRPKGKAIKRLSLEPVKQRLEKLLITHYSLPITFVNIKRYIGDNAAKVVKEMQPSQIIMLENLRFSDRERANCKKFAKKLAGLADIYVNNAFANSHRAHASMDAIQKYLPSYIGFGLEEEIKNLSLILNKPQKPLVLIIGGAKIETKLPVIKKFIKKADHILIGGAVANNFIKALGYEVGKSLVDDKYLKQAKKTLKHLNTKALKHGLILPVDIVISHQSSVISKRIDKITKNESILDIGPETIKFYSNIIKSAKTIIWNGPMGKFEDKKFKAGTEKIAAQIIKSKAKIVIGGGDTDKLFKNKKISKNIFISSGGGAMLEFLAGKKLPGL